MGPMLSADMQAAGALPALGMFLAVELDLPGVGAIPAKTLRLLDGSGVLSWSGMSFVARDSDFGVWSGIGDPIEEEIAVQSPKFRAGFSGLSTLAITQLCQPQSQGAPVILYYGYFSLATGQPIATPVKWFVGAIDTCDIQVGESSVDVDVNVVSAAEYMMMNNEGARLNSAYHQTFFPGENGFAFVDNVQHQIPWGASGPRPDQVTDRSNWDNTPTLPGTTLRF